jgi:PleD family two-component response regulator
MFPCVHPLTTVSSNMTKKSSLKQSVSPTSEADVKKAAGMPLRERILIVDDEPTTIQVLTRFLTREGYAVVTASNGEEALRQIQQVKPDLVLLDVTMPILDGLSVCRRLRQDYLTRSLPIILVTGRDTLNDRLSGIRVGIDDYITKPFDLEEVKARLENVLQRRRWDLWSHPLTHLPGSPAIEEEVRKWLRHGSLFAFAYIDIDYFKAFNDIYGYDAGDKVIKDLSVLLLEAVKGSPDGRAFTGHVGGDDFVFLSTIDHMKQCLPRLAEAFDARRAQYYRPDDFKRGGLQTKNRRGEEKAFPLMTLSLAVVSTQTRKIEHYARLVEIASELKHYLKTQEHEGKSMVLWDRRAD